ncbi:MAG: hypothetical protein Q9197_001743 [Variospora fuerteventurae]
MLSNITNVASVAVFASALGGYLNDLQLTRRTNVGNGIELRIMPLGGSITNGFQSTDNNGYRLTLQRNLAGSKLLLVGSADGGTMDDNYHEGWNGFTINQIAKKAKLTQAFLRPNIVLVHAGTNDLNMGPPIDPDHAPDRLGALVDHLISYGPEDTVILVAQIIDAANAKTRALIRKYNDAIPGMVAQRAANNHVAVVDFRNALSDSDNADGLHPNDVGYKKMGDIWFKAIQTAADKGWIKAPEGPTSKLGAAQGGRSTGDTSYCLTPPIWVPALRAGADVLWGRLEKTNRYSYIGVSPNSGALRAYKNGCTKFSPATDSSDSGQGSSTSGSGSSDSGSGTSLSSESSGEDSGGDGSGVSGCSHFDVPAKATWKLHSLKRGFLLTLVHLQGNGSGSGDSSSDIAIYITGGLLIPLTGLPGVGLPTRGVPALTSLRPYAITVQNDVATAQQAVENLKKGKPTSAGFLHPQMQWRKPPKALSAQADQIGTTYFDPSTASAIEQQKDDLRDASQSLSDAYPRLRGCVSSPSTCDSVFTGVLATLTSAAVTAPIVYFGSKGVDPQSSNGPPIAGGSGSGGAESNGPGGSGGPGGCNPIGPLGGGLPVPGGGLGSLGLPRTGTAAVAAFRAFAITAQSALGAAAGLVCGLGDSVSAGSVSSAADSLSGAASALSSQFDAIELSSFSGEALTAVQTQGAALRGASSALGSALKQLQTCISSKSCKNIIGTIILSITANEILNPVNWFLLEAPLAVKPSQTSRIPSAPSATSTSTSTSSPLPWVLNTRPGTSLVAFKAFIQKLPDGGSGRQIVYESLTTQFYVTSMTFEEALIVHAFPIVDQMVENTPMSGQAYKARNTANRPRKRDDPPRVVRAGPGTPTHLRWFSWRPDLPILGADLSDELQNYKYEASAGQGSYVYCFDTKIDWDHLELSGVPHELFVVPRWRKPGRRGDDDDHIGTIYDWEGHGTTMAGAIAGNFLGVGVAPRTTIVEVVWGAGYDLVPNVEDIVDAFAWAVNDVRNTPAKMFRSVFSIAWGFRPGHVMPRSPIPDRRYEIMGLTSPSFDDIFLPLLAETWLAEIPVVVGAGNEKNGAQGNASPQRHASARNPLIVVGALQSDGNVWWDPTSQYGTEPPGPASDGSEPGLVGELSVIVLADQILEIIPDISDARYVDTGRGTSLATAEISGLLAYFMGLPAPFRAPVGGPNFGSFAFNAKQLVVALARNPNPRPGSGPDARGSPGFWGHAYNNVFQIIATCPGQPVKRSDDLSLNQTSAFFWDEVERLYWANKGLAPP